MGRRRRGQSVNRYSGMLGRRVCASGEELEPRTMLAATITEFVASNAGGFEDGLGRSPDWIEIHNSGADAIPLAGYALTDDPSIPNKWLFPERELAAGEYLVVFATGSSPEDVVDPAGNLHTNFKLRRAGDFLAFYDAAGNVLTQFGNEEFGYPEQLANVSYGFGQADGLIGYMVTPTPGAANVPDAEIFAGFVEDTKYSVDRGYFSEPFELEISTATENAEIRYTRDGTEPTLSNGVVYDGPITVGETAHIRAAAFLDGLLPTNVDTQTYLFLDDVLTQDGSGLPDTWGVFEFGSSEAEKGSAVPANYEVDPDVVNDERYRDTLVDDLRSLPAVSLVLPADDLWSEETGIYANTLNEGVEWERGGSIELIDTDGSSQFQVDAGIRIHGGFGRRPAASAKHSFRLFFKGEYGASKLDFPWFGEDGADEFDTIVLRANYNYSWVRGDRGGVQTGREYTMINDRWANLAQQEMGGITANGTFVHLFVNGLYWGVYNPSERPDASFQASYRGGSKEDYDVVNHEGLVDGNGDAWDQLLSTVRANPLDYNAVAEQLDVDNFIDYMILNQYGGNTDWPNNNWYASRLREAGEKWEFHAWDSEFFFVEPSANRVATLPSSGPGILYRELKDNAEFKARYADRVQRHFFNGGVLTTDRNVERLNELAEIVDRGVVGESARWGDGWMDQRETPRTRDDDWLPRLDVLRNDYFASRRDTVLDQFVQAGLFSNFAAPELSQFGGVVGSGFLLELTQRGNADIYFTVDGSDPRGEDGQPSATAMLYAGPVEIDSDLLLATRAFRNGNWTALVEAPFDVQVAGDVNDDLVVDASDIDLLCAGLHLGEDDSRFDLTGDGVVDHEDRNELLQILGIGLGDANLDQVFDSSDLIQVFAAGEYEDSLSGNSFWSTGDWNCDGEFDTGDLVTAFQSGAYTAAAQANVLAAASTQIGLENVKLSANAMRETQSNLVRNDILAAALSGWLVDRDDSEPDVDKKRLVR